MLTHAQRQRDRPALDEPRVERADRPADVDHRLLLDAVDELGRTDHRATHRVPVTVDVLRQRVHHQIGTQLEGAQVHGRGERRIDAEDGTHVVRDRGDGRDVGHPRRRVGRCLDMHQDGIRAEAARTASRSEVSTSETSTPNFSGKY